MMDTVTFHLVVPEYPATGVSEVRALQGTIVGLGVQYNLGIYSASLDIAITEEADDIPTQEIWSLNSGATDGWFYPVAQICGVDGALLEDKYIPMSVYGDVHVAIANALPGDSVDITFRLM